MCSTPSLGRSVCKSLGSKGHLCFTVLWLCTEEGDETQVSWDKCFRTTKLGMTHRRLLGSSGELMSGCANEKDELEDVKTTRAQKPGLARDQYQLDLSEHSHFDRLCNMKFCINSDSFLKWSEAFLRFDGAQNLKPTNGLEQQAGASQPIKPFIY